MALSSSATLFLELAIDKARLERVPPMPGE